MKKSLLIAVAALFVALGANAQVKRTSLPVKKAGLESAQLEKMALTPQASAAPVFRSKLAKAPKAAAGEIDGEYLLNADNFEGDFTECSFFTIESSTGQITLDQYEGEPTFDYNVVLNDFSWEGAVVYGEYNADEGMIYIPVQQIGFNATYKEIYISGGYRSGAENLRYGKPIILIVNEDGTMDIDEDIDPDDPDDDATTGFVSYLPNYVNPNTGEEGGLWNYGFDIQVMKPNGTMEFTARGNGFGSPDGWSKTSRRVFIEDYGTEWVVNNFLGLTPVSVTLDSDDKCFVTLGQKMYDYDQEEPYGYFRLVGITYDGDYIVRDYDKTALNGFYEDGYCEFFKVEYKEAWTDDEGSHDAGYYYVDDDPDYVRYVAVATANDADGLCYLYGYACNMTIESDEHATSGILAPKTTVENPNAQVYDLQGRAVNSNYKGIVIQNGKKFVVK
jgi:hypothetical protein